MLYTIYMWLVLTFFTIFYGIILTPFLPFDKKHKIYWAMVRLWAKTIVFLSRIKLEINGIEKIPKEPCVYMSNHQSYFDAIVLLGYLPVPVRFVAKKILKYIPVFGQLMWATGHIIIDRKNPVQAFKELDKAVEKIKRGTSVLIFPEGTRSPNHILGPFKKGGFVLAQKAKVPIVPISIAGTRPMMPKGSYSFKRTEVKVTVCEPIAVSELSVKEKEELIQEVRKAIITNFPEGSNEAKANMEELIKPPPKAA